MKAEIVQYLSGLGLGSETTTVLIATLPVFELRGSIPWATFVFDMHWWSAYFWSILGNLIPVPFILLLLDPIRKFFSRNASADKLFQWLFTRTRRRSAVIEKYQAVGLILFVAIPLPVTGAWTGAMAAYLFGIKFHKAIINIFCGILIAGIVVTLACQGLLGFWDLSKSF